MGISYNGGALPLKSVIVLFWTVANIINLEFPGMGPERQGRLDGNSQLESTFWFSMAIIMGSSGIRSGTRNMLIRSNRVRLGRNCGRKDNTNNGTSKALGSSYEFG